MIRKLFILIISFWSVLSAQNELDSTGYINSFNRGNKTLFSNSLEKQINTYRLNNILSYTLSDNSVTLNFRNIYNSNVYKLASQTTIRDENNFRIGGSYRINDNFSGGFYSQSQLYSDDRSLAISNASLIHGIMYLEYQVLARLSFLPFGGFAQNTQINQTDNGYIFGLEGSIRQLDFEGSALNGTALIKNEDINPRKNVNRNITLSIDSPFDEGIKNNLSFQYDYRENDFYISADSSLSGIYGITNNIQQRSESNLIFRNSVSFDNPSDKLFAELGGKAEWRNVDRSTRYFDTGNIKSSTFDDKISEFRYDIFGRFSFFLGSSGWNINLSLGSREELHEPKMIEGANIIFFEERKIQEERKNNINQITNINISGFSPLSKNGRLIFNIFLRKMQYDTPSDLNFDDRDEILSILRIGYEYALSPVASFSLDLEGNFNHLVYIFAERSSNNSRRRVLKLAAASNLLSKDITNRFQGEIQADYTTYDFEDLNPNYKSFSFRSLLFRDSLVLPIIRRAGLEFQGYTKFSEQGEFNWADFKSRPQRFLTEYYLNPGFYFENENMRLGVGYRYFDLTTYLFLTPKEKDKNTVYSSYGPITQISWKLNQRSELRFSGYYEFISNEKLERREMATMNLYVRWNI